MFRLGRTPHAKLNAALRQQIAMQAEIIETLKHSLESQKKIEALLREQLGMRGQAGGSGSPAPSHGLPTGPVVGGSGGSEGPRHPVKQAGSIWHTAAQD